MSVADALARVKAEDDAKNMRLAAAQLRKFLATALCAHCGDVLGEGELCQTDDEEQTVHKHCLDLINGEPSA